MGKCSIENPDGKQKLFLPHVLPFGASASVYAFNKMAKALHVVGMFRPGVFSIL